jgi:hypothetical protein
MRYRDLDTESIARQDSWQARCEEVRTKRRAQGVAQWRQFPCVLARAEQRLLCGREVRSRQAPFVSRSATVALGGLHDADELHLQIPQV